MELIIFIRMDLVWNNLQRLTCHKTKPNQTKLYHMTEVVQAVQGIHAVIDSITNSASKAAKLGFMLPKYRKTFDWP